MLEGQKCLVIGSGISGIGAVALLEKYHADVVLYDSSDKLTKEDLEAKLPGESKAVCIAGELPEEVLRDLCGRSYALAVEKLPKYVRRELAEAEAAKAAPQHQAVTHKGTRDSHTMNDQASFSTVPPVNAPQTAPAGMSTEPSSRLAATNTKMTTTNIPPHTYPLRSTGIIFFSPLIYENICHLPPLPRPDGIFLSNLSVIGRDGKGNLRKSLPSLCCIHKCCVP